MPVQTSPLYMLFIWADCKHSVMRIKEPSSHRCSDAQGLIHLQNWTYQSQLSAFQNLKIEIGKAIIEFSLETTLLLISNPRDSAPPKSFSLLSNFFFNRFYWIISILIGLGTSKSAFHMDEYSYTQLLIH